MPRLPTPASIEASPASSQPLLQAVKKQLGVVPNLFRLVGNSPAALEGYLGLNGSLAKGALEAPTRERIALAVAEINGCDYCLSAHSYLGKNLAKLSDAEIAANRAGGSADPKAGAAVGFAVKLVNTRGHVSDADIKAVKNAGYTDAQVIEIVLHVALNTLTNYVNEVAKTEIDFPVVAAPGLPDPTHSARRPSPPRRMACCAQSAKEPPMSDTHTCSSDVAFTPAVRAIQVRKGSRNAYADVEQRGGWRTEIDQHLTAFLAEANSLYFATATADGQPYIQHRGGPKGFIRVLDKNTLAFADYSGNRQYITQGNLSENPKANIFLMDYAHRRRIKIWGEARVVDDDPALLKSLMPGGYKARPEQVVLFKISAWDTNCPRHIPQKFDAADVAAALASRDARIAELEAELAALRGARPA